MVYYTLEEACKILQSTPSKIKEMAKAGELRAFQDRGNLRFRAQEIDELARTKGLGSEPELILGDSSAPDAGPPTPRTGPKSPTPEDAGVVLDFNISSGESGSKGPLSNDPPSGAKSGPPSSATRKKTSPRPSTLKAPPPMVSSDSDVRLVAEGSDLDFKISEDPAAAAKSPRPGPKSPPPSKPQSDRSKGTPTIQRDSSIRLIPPEKSSDSDVKLVGEMPDDPNVPLGKQPLKKPSDSDIRMDAADQPLESPSGRRKRHEVITEEIDLDAEFAKAEQIARAKGAPLSGSKMGKPTQLPTSSPFELSEADLKLGKSPRTPPPAAKSPKTPPPGAKSPKTPPPSKKPDESSDEFTVARPKDDSSAESSPLSGSGSSSPMEASSDEVPLLMGDDEVSLGELSGAAGGSGINLQDPADSGISLESSDSHEVEFELSLDPSDEHKALGLSDPPPPPAKKKGSGKTALGKEEPSEFELSLKDDESSDADAESGSDSEFELTLDGEDSVEPALEKISESGSDSEFELTLDDGGGLAAVDEAGGLAGDEEKDIFETDFEVPALQDESGSEALALESDTDVETSDFDLSSSDESDIGSQVVELEDEADAGAETVKRPARGAKAAIAAEAEVEEDAEELLDEDDYPTRTVAVAAPPAEWGVAVPIGLLFTVLMLFFVGMMSFELVQGMWGYHRGAKVPGLFVNWAARQIDDTIPKND